MARIIGLIFIVLFAIYCDSEDIFSPISIEPQARVFNMPGFTFHVSGNGFSSSSTIIFNGVKKETLFINDSLLQCTIDSQDIAGSSFLHQSALESSTLQYETFKVEVITGYDIQASQFKILSNHSFSSGQNISQSAKHSRYPVIFTDMDKNLLVMWSDESNQSNNNGETIYFNCFNPKQQTWLGKEKVNVPQDFLLSTEIFCRTAEGIGYSMWGRYNETTHRNESHLAVLEPQLNLKGYKFLDPQGDSALFEDAFCSAKGNIFVVWNDHDESEKSSTIWFASIGTGGNLMNPTRIFTSGHRSHFPSIRGDHNGNLYVVWQEYGFQDKNKGYTVVSRSSDKGVSWSQPLVVFQNTSLNAEPAIAVDHQGVVYVIDTDYSNVEAEITFAQSVDQGRSWTEKKVIASNQIGYKPSGPYPKILVDSQGNISVFYFGYDGQLGKIAFYMRSVNGGVNWSLPQRISSKPVTAPYVFMDHEGDLFMAWYAGIGESPLQTNFEIFICNTKFDMQKRY